jgi:hypothetical protein
MSPAAMMRWATGGVMLAGDASSPEKYPMSLRTRSAIVGVLCPSSICPSMARLTPEARASRSSESPRRTRRRRRFVPTMGGEVVCLFVQKRDRNQGFAGKLGHASLTRPLYETERRNATSARGGAGTADYGPALFGARTPKVSGKRRQPRE